MKDLPNHGFESSLSTCWILEGLIMYHTESLLKEVSDLASNGSYLILNFIKQDGDEYISAVLKENGWKQDSVVFFFSCLSVLLLTFPSRQKNLTESCFPYLGGSSQIELNV